MKRKIKREMKKKNPLIGGSGRAQHVYQSIMGETCPDCGNQTKDGGYDPEQGGDRIYCPSCGWECYIGSSL